MTATEQALEKERHLREDQARRLLRWLAEQECTGTVPPVPQGAAAMLGFARRSYPEPRTTAEWLRELREGEE
jgi:hypothetical protein